MNRMRKLLLSIVPSILLGSVATPVVAGDIVLSGSIACSASHFTRKGGFEIHDRTYGLRNFNSKSTVTITRVRAWDNDGTNTFDGLLAVEGFKATLQPHESGRFNASDVLPAAEPRYNTQQIRIDYKLDRPGMPLHAGFAHFVRRTDPGSNNYQTARQGGECTHIPPAARHSMRGARYPEADLADFTLGGDD